MLCVVCTVCMVRVVARLSKHYAFSHFFNYFVQNLTYICFIPSGSSLKYLVSQLHLIRENQPC